MKRFIFGIVLGALLFALYAHAGQVLQDRRDNQELATLMLRADIPGKDIVKYLDLLRGDEFRAGDSVLVIERGNYGQPLKVYIRVVDTTCVLETKMIFDLTVKK